MVDVNSSTDTYSNAFRAVGITFNDILTQDSVMMKELEQAKTAAKSDVSVMILGETGTGKNLLAQSIHNESKRIEHSFVSINCSAIPDTLLESELFGHEKGAFTSAERQRRGCFERANNGTIFLDEIGEMTLEAQVKVLNVIEYKQFSKVGGEVLQKTDVRIISATNRDLAMQIERKKFRTDLFYRLNEVVVLLPPLRNRKKDIPMYVKYFISEANEKYSRTVKKLTKSAMRKLDGHKWLGNVRELRSVIRSAIAVSKKDIIDDKDIALMSIPLGNDTGRIEKPQVLSIRTPDDDSLDDEDTHLDIKDDLSLETYERNHILKVLRIVKWKKKKASLLLNISRPTLDRKIELYGLSKDMDKF